MTTTPLPAYGPPALTLHALRGHRFIEGPGGAAPVPTPPPAAPAAPQAAEPPAGAAPPAPAPAGATEPPAAGPGESVEGLPKWAQRIIFEARKEAGDYRIAKNTSEQQLATLRESAAVALGIKEPATADPAALASALKQAQETARENAVRLAVFQAAGIHKADPNLLLDSATFLKTVTTLDPSAGDFATTLSTAIKNAVEGNPHLKTVRATGASSADLPSGGTGENGPITAEQLRVLSATDPQRVVELHTKGLLDHLL